MNLNKFTFFLFLLLLLNAFGQKKAIESLNNTLTSPIIGPNHILFIATNQAKSIKIILETEKWKPIEMVYDEKTMMWYYIYEKELTKGKYRYKLSIDNFLTTDPLNPNKEKDKLGGYFSFFELKDNIEIFKSNPKRIENGYYEFRYIDLKAEKVVLVGSFNNWNPYELELKREYGGIWKIKIYLPKGTHYYYFIVDDQITPDPMNTKAVKDKHGNIINIIEVNE